VPNGDPAEPLGHDDVMAEVGSATLNSSAARFLDRWADTLTACGHSSAYPAWLIARRAETDTALSTSQRAS
jgi:hypothetical protein